ncbi:DUF11 domain-containing protein [Meiothermus sp. CFH 77666]|uniref:DUF11 domain-containing protein n=1 Tax=Meiothermus sp. CFH 77666 TaxID=2817942 RepID=UPI001AA046BA|nr:DUF11 domain-containing protein [Meiothermus sp. CFH 77666]MBO1437697.1 DUF11 domain-containing protein [Meiothermus sp. CFH 77666]
MNFSAPSCTHTSLTAALQKVLRVGWGLAWVLLLHLAWATPAGTVIRNQATALVGGQVYLSNEIETVVQAVCAPSLTPNGTLGSPAQRAVVPAGGFAYFAYLLRNSGNQSFTFNLGWIQDSAPWAPSLVRLYHDANANARLDAGEVEISSVTLGPAQEIRLILELQTPLSASGELHIGPVATCPDGTRDNDNYSRVSIGTGPALNVVKSVDTPEAQEGQEVRFSIRVWNLGSANAAGPIYVSDLLDTPELRDLTYVTGSASAAKGRLEYYDGTSWNTSETGVRGIRLVLEGLEAGEEALFSFRMRVGAGALAGPRRNIVSAESASSSAQSSVELRIAAQYALALGPLNNPQAVGAADRQSAQVLAGQPYCFTHTLLNGGNTADSYTLEAVGLPSGISLSYQTLLGSNLSTPITLPAGASLSFRVCLPGLPAGTAPFEFILQARSTATGSTDPTTNQVQVLSFSQLVLRKSSSVGPTVSPGERVVYTLEIENPLPIALENVTVEDVLDANLEFISASGGGTYLSGSRTVRWSLSLAANSTRTLSLEARVSPSAPDNSSILNRFSLRSEAISSPLFSNTVTLNVLASALLLEKQVQPRQASVGDLLTYTLTLVNVGRVDLSVRLEDTPDAGLAYVPGSATPGEPLLQGGRLVWNNLTLTPGARMVLSYKMRVLAGAGPTLRNTVQAIGSTGSNAAVANAVASAVVQLQQGVFTPLHSLLGRVFLDANRDGLYTAGLDVPLPGARVLLSNGLQTLTDSEGRYSFRNLAGGLFEVMLEAASAPFRPLPHPEAQGDGYRHRVRVEGLTVSDFPLERPTGLVRAIRETTLEFGPLKVEKKLLPLPSGLRVVLVLSSAETLNELTLTDPLPGGGERVFRFEQFQGTQTLTYDLPDGFLTDPQARWRYP